MAWRWNTEARYLYKSLNTLKETTRKKRFLKNDDGSLIITDEELTKKYANDFDKLLDCEQLLEVFPPSRNTRNYQLCLA